MFQTVAVVTSIVMSIAAVVNLVTIYLTVQHFRQRALYDALNQINEHQDQLNRVLSLDGKPYSHWSDEDKAAANTICVDLFHIGGLVRYGTMSMKFCELYYYTIPRVHQICSEYISEMRSTRHPEYWRKFDELVEITKRHNAGTEFEV